MILTNWIAATGGDYRHARKVVEKDSEETPEDVANWFRLYDQYIERYGLGEKYKRIFKIMKKKALLELKFVRTRDRMLLTRIEIESERLKQLMKDNGKGMTVEASLIHLSRWFHSMIKPSEISVVQYQTLLEEYGKNSAA